MNTFFAFPTNRPTPARWLATARPLIEVVGQSAAVSSRARSVGPAFNPDDAVLFPKFFVAPGLSVVAAA